MNYPRAIGFGVAYYAISFTLYGILMRLGIVTAHMTMGGYVIWWLLNIPILLLLAKWFFSKVTPSTQSGALLGIVTMVIVACLDGLLFLAFRQYGSDTTQFTEAYSSWQLYVAYLEILLLTTYAGYEFDKRVPK